ESPSGGRSRPRPVTAAAGRVLHAAHGRLRRRGPEGRGHRHGRLRPLVAAAPRGCGAERFERAVPVAQPQQGVDPAQPQDRRWQGDPPAARQGLRRPRRVVSARRARPPRRRLRRAQEGEPGARLLRDLRLRPDRPVSRPLRARHELPRAHRPARAHRRVARLATHAVRRADRRPRRRRADGRVRDPRRAARARPHRRGPGRRRLDGRRRAV
ncbi:MAG: Alpha-methylacyl-CoA racemase, partial [uncultured Solirubrobacteraceae bacterium]